MLPFIFVFAIPIGLGVIFILVSNASKKKVFAALEQAGFTIATKKDQAEKDLRQSALEMAAGLRDLKSVRAIKWHAWHDSPTRLFMQCHYMVGKKSVPVAVAAVENAGGVVIEAKRQKSKGFLFRDVRDLSVKPVETGDPDFDRDWYVRAADADAARALLTAERRAWLNTLPRDARVVSSPGSVCVVLDRWFRADDVPTLLNLLSTWPAAATDSGARL